MLGTLHSAAVSITPPESDEPLPVHGFCVTAVRGPFVLFLLTAQQPALLSYCFYLYRLSLCGSVIYPTDLPGHREPFVPSLAPALLPAHEGEVSSLPHLHPFSKYPEFPKIQLFHHLVLLPYLVAPKDGG